MRWLVSMLAIAIAVGSSPARATAEDAIVCAAISEASPQDRVTSCTNALSERGRESAALASLHALRGLAYSDLQDSEKAIPDLTAAIKRDPRATYYYWRGLAQQRANKTREALADYNEAIKLDPKIPAARINRAIIEGQLGDFAGGVVDCSAVLRENPNHVMALVNRALLQVSRGRFAEAERDLARAEQQAPAFPGVTVIRALTHLLRHQYELAVAKFSTLIEAGDSAMPKQLTEPLVARAMAYGGLKQFDKARSDLAAAEKSWGDPASCVSCLVGHAALNGRQGRFETAETYVTRALARDPDSRQVQIARCHVRAGGAKPEEAIAICSEVAARYSQSILPIQSRGSAYLKLGKLDAALKDYDTSLKMGDWTGIGHFGRGIIFKRRGQATKAQTEFALARAIVPDVEEEFATFGIKP